MVSSACLDPRPLCSRFCVGAMERSPICVGLPVWLQLLIRNEHEWALEDDFMADENHVRRNLDLVLMYEGEGKDRLVDEAIRASYLVFR